MGSLGVSKLKGSGGLGVKGLLAVLVAMLLDPSTVWWFLSLAVKEVPVHRVVVPLPLVELVLELEDGVGVPCAVLPEPFTQGAFCLLLWFRV